MKHLGMGLGMTLGLAIGLAGVLATAPMANAGGWATVHRYVKPSGNCAGAIA